ncbi:MAG: two-component system, OmpR family, operon response regulator KdpE [Microbacteriaceae bacterium]|jgi:two-component system KDP operon response regulator KdpE|nr:two-component system response regulator [Microbacteriaceae bacterium]MDQ1548428.1 two-component system, OmpR family, operon response regulator KdpE [Microbacteriaceae bacterium]MDQ1553390.1 two-component system, OmpR family, operon response regulator KdpE [Microbacteriaceae bacterium]
MRVLIVDDDAQILRALRINLAARGYDVSLARTGPEALDVAAKTRPELVILDLGLPGLSGIQVIEGIRGWTDIPILVVSGRSDSADKVDALDAGADDYVTKPFAVDELLARVRALTRRSPLDAEQPVVEFGLIRVDLAAHEVTRPDTDGSRVSIKLTPTEWHILEVLVRNPRRLVTKNFLLTTVWGPAYENEDGYLRLYLAQLRKKLEPEPSRPRYLLTEPGMGYRFVPDQDESLRR